MITITAQLSLDQLNELASVCLTRRRELLGIVEDNQKYYDDVRRNQPTDDSADDELWLNECDRAVDVLEESRARVKDWDRLVGLLGVSR